MAADSTASLEYRIDYLPLILLLILIMLFAWFVLFKLRTLNVRKYILQKKTIREGTQFTVGIEIKNSTGKKISNLVIKDFIPPVFAVRESVGLRYKKKKTNYGTDLTWKLKDLKNGEERIVSYKIVPVFGLNTTMNLPNARISYISNDKTFHTNSGGTVLGVDPKKKKQP